MKMQNPINQSHGDQVAQPLTLKEFDDRGWRWAAQATVSDEGDERFRGRFEKASLPWRCPKCR
jgi:hypothetical protein